MIKVIAAILACFSLWDITKASALLIMEFDTVKLAWRRQRPRLFKVFGIIILNIAAFLFFVYVLFE